jgi:hypothetical protein
METRLLTYAELGAALGITAASAKRLSNRRKWSKTVGNDGLSRVYVPMERLTVERPIPEDAPRDNPGDTPGDAPDAVSRDISDGEQGILSVLGILTRHVERLETDLVTLRDERDVERQQVTDLTLKAAQVDVLRELIASEQRRVADLERRADEFRLEREALMRVHRDQIEDLRAERDKLSVRWMRPTDFSPNRQRLSPTRIRQSPSGVGGGHGGRAHERPSILACGLCGCLGAWLLRRVLWRRDLGRASAAPPAPRALTEPAPASSMMRRLVAVAAQRVTRYADQHG